MVINQTENDLAKEGIVAKIMEGKMGYKIHDNRRDTLSHIDRTFYNKRYERWFRMEIKCRNIKWDDYDTKYLSAYKFAMSVPYLHQGIGFMYVMATHDRIGVWNTLHASKVVDYSKEYCGRNDRGQPNDMELMIHLPNDKFYTFELTNSHKELLWKSNH